MKTDSTKCLFCYDALGQSEIDFHFSCSRKFFGSNSPPLINFGIDDAEEFAIQMLGKSISLTGMQPKLSLNYKKNNGRDKRLTITGLWGNFILKLPSEKYTQMPEIEDLTMHLAEILKIKTAVHSLIRLKSGELAYLSRRFDRTKNHKLHLEDMAQLTGMLTGQKYSESMENVGNIILKFSDFPGYDAVRLFELILFSFVTGNSDMHLKKFSLLRDEDDEIILSPSYDLISTKLLNPGDIEELALPLNGKKNNLKKEDFDYFAEKLLINEKTLSVIYGRYRDSISNMNEFVNKSFLTENLKQKFIQIISKRINILFGDTCSP